MTHPVRILDVSTPAPEGAVVVDTTSQSPDAWSKELSPFRLGPCPLYKGWSSRRLENAWQFSKVYEPHVAWWGEPSLDYWNWATWGWSLPRAVRYPMGKGAKPLYAWWNGKKLGYIEARMRIYIPLYGRAVLATRAWRKLKMLYETAPLLVLRDFDGYDHAALGMTLTDVLNDPTRKMGHAFVLAMLLGGDPALDPFEIGPSFPSSPPPAGPATTLPELP